MLLYIQWRISIQNRVTKQFHDFSVRWTNFIINSIMNFPQYFFFQNWSTKVKVLRDSVPYVGLFIIGKELSQCPPIVVERNKVMRITFRKETISSSGLWPDYINIPFKTKIIALFHQGIGSKISICQRNEESILF